MYRLLILKGIKLQENIGDITSLKNTLFNRSIHVVVKQMDKIFAFETIKTFSTLIKIIFINIKPTHIVYCA